MNKLKDCFEQKPYRDQTRPEQYAYILHRVSFPICIIGSAVIAFGLFTFCIVFVNWLLG